MFYRTINIVFPSLLHTQFIYVDVYLSIFFKNKELKRKILFYVFIFAHIFLNSLNELKYQWFSLLIIVLNNSGWKISRVLSIFSPLLFYHCQCRAKSIGLRWEIKKASIVSSNLGILAPVLEGNYSSIKFDIFFALLELKRYRFDYFVFVAKII